MKDRKVMHYAELHAKTNFSFLEGASHPDELVARAAELGYAALAITDRNSLAGVVRAHAAAKQVGLKLLFGAEITQDAARVARDRPGGVWAISPPDHSGTAPDGKRGMPTDVRRRGAARPRTVSRRDRRRELQIANCKLQSAK